LDFEIFVAAIIVDGNSQFCFHKSMLTKATAKKTVHAVVLALWPNKYCSAIKHYGFRVLENRVVPGR
jgi:hypothetical protein